MPVTKQGWGKRLRVFGLWGKMIACDVSQVVILGQESVDSTFSQQRGSDWGKALGLIRVVSGRDEL